MCTLYSFFSPRPSAVGYIVQPHTCHIIEHIFVPTRSAEGNIEKIRFSWVSNSKFVIFPQIYPCSNYKIFPNVPPLFPVSNGDSPVVTTFPRSNYRGFLTTGESYCTMYTLCIAGKMKTCHYTTRYIQTYMLHTWNITLPEWKFNLTLNFARIKI